MDGRTIYETDIHYINEGFHAHLTYGTKSTSVKTKEVFLNVTATMNYQPTYLMSVAFISIGAD
jgi:hypothetical protein